MPIPDPSDLARDRRIARVLVRPLPGNPVRVERVLFLWPLPPLREGDTTHRLARDDAWTVLLEQATAPGQWHPGVLYADDCDLQEVVGDPIPPVDLSVPTSARDPLRLAEHLALAARFEVRCHFDYRAKDAAASAPPQERDGTVLGTRGDLVFAKDHHRDATRSFTFGGMVKVWARSGAPLPRWDGEAYVAEAPPAGDAPWEG